MFTVRFTEHNDVTLLGRSEAIFFIHIFRLTIYFMSVCRLLQLIVVFSYSYTPTYYFSS